MPVIASAAKQPHVTHPVIARRSCSDRRSNLAK